MKKAIIWLYLSVLLCGCGAQQKHTEKIRMAWQEPNVMISAETVDLQPWDAYANRNMSLDTKVGAYMDERSCGGTKGYCVQWPIWNAVLPSWTMEDGKITQVKLYPVELGMEKKRSQKGCPVLNRSVETLEYMRKLSAPFGTRIEIRDGVGYVDFE